ncbi:hypothetical protein AK88_02999 [Plasmodium fragile]|uniref:Plasmodium RESA N-terminal domain-containing protein n=1 Tax=Plasmodium fragile TaxID=5857 RepID=A0A0D9QJX2_PLAFR|nr:uncharacterized protein AK88_02999 [Plasmodium fragile]KJP87319.1 hypothetical protein AK88_02999 [Plasmodium fragile]
MNHKNARLDNVVRPRTFTGSLLYLSLLLLLVHPFIVAPANLLPAVEPKRHYEVRIIAETSSSNDATQMGDVKPPCGGGSIKHGDSMQGSSKHFEQMEATNTHHQVHPKGPKKDVHEIPRTPLGNYNTSSTNVKSQMKTKNEKINQSQKNNHPNHEKHMPEQSIKLTERELHIMLKNLTGVVSRKHMFILWFNFHNLYVRKYNDMIDEMRMYAESFASRHNMSKENVQAIWSRIHGRLISELRQKDVSCINAFFDLLDKGECTADVFIAFLEETKKVWTDTIDKMSFKW